MDLQHLLINEKVTSLPLPRYHLQIVANMAGGACFLLLFILMLHSRSGDPLFFLRTRAIYDSPTCTIVQSNESKAVTPLLRFLEATEVGAREGAREREAEWERKNDQAGEGLLE